MNRQEADQEVNYRLLKIIISNMVSENLLEEAEADKIRQSAIIALTPIIGCLEVDNGANPENK